MRAKKSEKFIIAVASLFVGVALYLGAYAYFSKNLTEWQQNQPVDMQARTGTTKLKVQLDSLSIGGAGFAITMLLLFIRVKRAQKKLQKRDE